MRRRMRFEGVGDAVRVRLCEEGDAEAEGKMADATFFHASCLATIFVNYCWKWMVSADICCTQLFIAPPRSFIPPSQEQLAL